MRVFRRTGEFRAPAEPGFSPGLVRPERDDPTGFADRASAVRFADVGGLDGVLDDLRDVVGYLADPARYELLGARPPTGILLHGEPGCGKTLLGRALAGEVGVPFYFVSATSFVERFVGLGASRIRELFQTAVADRPSIVFIDELDAVGRRRTDAAGDREFDHTLNQLLVELDGFLGASGVITIGATNRPELLDPALVRPGRFDRRIEIGRPDRDGRMAVLRLHAAPRPCAPDIDWAKVAEATEGCSPAELAGLLNEAALLAARDRAELISGADLERAMDRLASGGPRPAESESELARRAVHQAGHAVVALCTPDATPAARITVAARGRRGRNPWSASGRRELSTGPQLVAELVVLYGGWAAEQLLLGSASTLGEPDLDAAIELAERIERCRLGPRELPEGRADLLAWARQSAGETLRRQPGAVRSIAAALRADGSMFSTDAAGLLPS